VTGTPATTEAPAAESDVKKTISTRKALGPLARAFGDSLGEAGKRLSPLDSLRLKAHIDSTVALVFMLDSIMTISVDPLLRL